MLGHVSTPGPITVAEVWVLPVAIFGHIPTGCQVCYPEVGDKVLAEKKKQTKTEPPTSGGFTSASAASAFTLRIASVLTRALL